MPGPRIAVLALGASNFANVCTGLRRAGGDPFAARTPDELANAQALVIPGVANVAYLIESMDALGLREPVRQAVAAGMPALGVCAGFQLCFESSDEAPGARGLGFFEGRVEALQARKVPHVGWNGVEPVDASFPGGWAYFAHSFAVPEGARDAVATTQHGGSFVSAARRNNLIGVQFHPERSGDYGASLLAAFVLSAAVPC